MITISIVFAITRLGNNSGFHCLMDSVQLAGSAHRALHRWPDLQNKVR